MKWLDATERLLREAETPLHYEKLADAVISQKLVNTNSQTPAITLHVSVSSDVRRRHERGLPARFAIKRGMISLAEWDDPGPAGDVVAGAERTRDKAQRQLLSKLRQLDGEEFESYLEVLFTRMGYDVTVVGGSGDDGIDLIAELGGGINPHRIGVQAKCLGHSRSVGPNPVRLLRDALPAHNCTAGAVIATCKFNDDAQRVAAEPGRPPISLIDHNELTALAAEHGVGIAKEVLTTFREDLDSAFATAEPTE